MAAQRHRRLSRRTALAVALVTLGAVADVSLAVTARSGQEDQAVITGSVLYRERIALTPEAVVTVQLLDTSEGGMPLVIAEQRIESPGQVPVAFALVLAYDASKIDAEHRYALAAQIEDRGRLMFASGQEYPVLTMGNPADGIEILVSLARD